MLTNSVIMELFAWSGIRK